MPRIASPRIACARLTVKLLSPVMTTGSFIFRLVIAHLLNAKSVMLFTSVRMSKVIWRFVRRKQQSALYAMSPTFAKRWKHTCENLVLNLRLIVKNALSDTSANSNSNIWILALKLWVNAANVVIALKEKTWTPTIAWKLSWPCWLCSRRRSKSLSNKTTCCRKRMRTSRKRFPAWKHNTSEGSQPITFCKSSWRTRGTYLPFQFQADTNSTRPCHCITL